jgi:hypothetical protein
MEKIGIYEGVTAAGLNTKCETKHDIKSTQLQEKKKRRGRPKKHVVGRHSASMS